MCEIDVGIVAAVFPLSPKNLRRGGYPSHRSVRGLTCALVGGLFFAPPSRLLDISPEPLRRSSPNFRYPPGHHFYTLWPRIFPKAMIGWSQMTSEWRHVLPFSTKKKGFAGRAVRPIALKIHKNVQDIKGVELPGLLNCYLEILKFLNFDP